MEKANRKDRKQDVAAYNQSNEGYRKRVSEKAVRADLLRACRVKVSLGSAQTIDARPDKTCLMKGGAKGKTARRAARRVLNSSRDSLPGEGLPSTS